MSNHPTAPTVHSYHFYVGHFFSSWDGHYYWCNSFDTIDGFWLTQLGPIPGREVTTTSRTRVNISVDAVGKTYNRVYDSVEWETCNRLKQQLVAARKKVAKKRK